MKIIFWLLWLFDLFTAMVIGYLILFGFRNQLFTKGNLLPWFISAGMAGTLHYSIRLMRQQQMVRSYLLLTLMAIPGLIILAFIIYYSLHPLRWQ